MLLPFILMLLPPPVLPGLEADTGVAETASICTGKRGECRRAVAEARLASQLWFPGKNHLPSFLPQTQLLVLSAYTMMTCHACITAAAWS